jgi:hypothetical protein
MLPNRFERSCRLKVGGRLADFGLAKRARREDPELTVDEYFASLDDQGGIVEERIEGDPFRSPRVQLRMSPAGQVDTCRLTTKFSVVLTARPTSDATSPPTRLDRVDLSERFPVGLKVERTGIEPVTFGLQSSESGTTLDDA